MLLRLGIFLVIAGFFPLLPGCTTGHDSYLTAEQIAANNSWEREIIETARFDLLTYHRFVSVNKELTIYIEGDGTAWRSRYSLSSNPTPGTPLVLELAAQDPSPSLAYLARPCQYVLENGHGRNCSSKYWSKARFGFEVVKALDEAITYLKKQAGASRIHIIGYSGGGGLAVLVAASRNDIASLRTIGGNLDHAEFTRLHKVSPLNASLNPIDFTEAVSMIPQIHFSGEKDRIVPTSITEKFLAELPGKNCASLVSVKEVSHSKGWQNAWPELLKIIPPCL